MRKAEFDALKANDKAREDRLRNEAAVKSQRDQELENRIDRRLHRAHQVMSGILFNMPSIPDDLASYFEQIDKLFDTNKVDQDLRISLLTPYLTERARKAVLGSSNDDVDTYDKFKAVILREHRLTPQAYRKNFIEAYRLPDESSTQFATRLTCLFRHYVESRKVTTFKELFELIVADRLKDSLKHYTRCYVADRENKEWLKPNRIAELVDLYEVERGSDKPNSQAQPFKPSYQSNNQPHKQYQDKDKSKDDQGHKYWREQITCFNCAGKGHMARDCPSKNDNYLKQSGEKPFNQYKGNSNFKGNTYFKNSANYKGHESYKGGASNSPPYKHKTITCYMCGQPNHKVSDCPKNKEKKVKKVTIDDHNGDDKSKETHPKQFNINRVELNSFPEITLAINCDTLKAESVSPIVETTNVSMVKSPVTSDTGSVVEVKLPRHIDFGIGAIKFIHDTGAQISVIKPDMIPLDFSLLDSFPVVNLQGAFGNTIKANLIEIQCRISDDQVYPEKRLPVSLCCAVTDELIGDEALISSADFETLMTAPNEVVLKVERVSRPDWLFAHPETVKLVNIQDKNSNKDENSIETHRPGAKLDRSSTENIITSQEILRNDITEKFKKAQIDDSTLLYSWNAFSNNDVSYERRSDNNLLYHFKVISGVKTAQLVLPLQYRIPVLESAHDSQWSMHFGVRKTIQRIEAHFFWPTLIKDVKAYVKSCGPCQLRLRRTKFDRVPISPVVRADNSFDQVNIDLIGPLEPKSSRGHKYILCLIDSCTRWVEAVPLKTLTAKEACDALISIFTRTGIPRITISDNGTNLVSGLNNELNRRLGIETRRSTPGHPEGNSLVERWNQSLKRMLNLVVNSDTPRDWDRQLPFLLWAYREIPNDTTGISPYQLLYGKPGRGPLAVLKDSWSNSPPDSVPLHHSVQDYMDKLKHNLDAGSAIAMKNAQVAQSNYVNYYNAGTRDKSFIVGEEVLVLHPNSTNKLVAQWIGPLPILTKVSQYSYQVRMPNDGVKTFHANNLRRYTSRVSCLGVVFDDDTEFGNLEPCPFDKEVFEDVIKDIDLKHLELGQQLEIRRLLTRFRDVFSDKPGTCNVAYHEINLRDDFIPQKQRAYRIPEKFKPEVERQVAQLLEDGKIKHSISQYAHPIVCVAKSNGEMRMCTDLRYVNSGTIDNAYPTPFPEELLLKISRARYITSLDCVSGYFQIPMRPSDTHKTAFITDKGLYEWLVMPFGVKTASSTFQKVMNDILFPHSDYANAYIDDTAVHSLSWSDHLLHLEGVLQAFLDVGMTLKLSKCHFAKPQVSFIGHIVGSGTRSVQQNKVEAISNIPEPTNKKQLRSFLGMCSFYRTYVPRFSEIALPLTNLTKNDQPTIVRFSAKHKDAFCLLKKKLCDAVGLHSPCADKPFIVHTDASDFAVGACLSQMVDGVNAPIAFVSAKLTDVQQRWSTIEKEAYAIIFALKKFDYLVFGRQIQLFTDHNPLQYITACTPKSAKLTRWALSLSRYNISVHHIKGSDNVVADYLSRA